MFVTGKFMIALFENFLKVGIFLAAALVFFVAHRWLSKLRENSPSSYERELNEVLTSDAYKVKRKFE